MMKHPGPRMTGSRKQNVQMWDQKANIMNNQKAQISFKK